VCNGRARTRPFDVQVSSKDEDFLDLSVDIEPNASITHCLRVFSNMETLACEHKYYCENCCSKQEAQKRYSASACVCAHVQNAHKTTAKDTRHTIETFQISRAAKSSHEIVESCAVLARIAAVQYCTWAAVCGYAKHRCFQSEGCENGEQLYDLVAVVVHCGSTPNRGHYITVVKSHTHWLLFDDDMVDVSVAGSHACRGHALQRIDPQSIEDFFGLSESATPKNSESAYILFYQARDCAAQ
jgi:ubiquitin carboxyl-terminal hydrolase 12/46